MMKDMKWKQIDTTYAGKAFQVEAEDINLHGDVNVQGTLSVNDSPLDAPTAAGTSYDNTASGLTGTNVQDAVDELADVRVKERNFNNLLELANFCITNYATIRPLVVLDDRGVAWNLGATSTAISMHCVYGSTGGFTTGYASSDGTTNTCYYMRGNDVPTITTAFDSLTYKLMYVD